MEQKVLRFGTVVIIGALFLRLLGGVGLSFILSPKLASWMFFFQTGRISKPVNIEFTDPPKPTDPTSPPETKPAPTPTKPTGIDIPTFSPADAQAITVSSGFSYQADLPALLSQPLSWDLTGSEPTVLIVHSHGTESFTGGGYKETSPYHTLEKDHNMLSIGAYVASILEAGGISVIHDTNLHDNPSYDLSYTNSRKTTLAVFPRFPQTGCLLVTARLRLPTTATFL